MSNKDNSNKKHTARNVRQKVTIISLSIALALSAGAAVAVPLVVKQTGGGEGEVTTYKVTFNGNGGTFDDGGETSKTVKSVKDELILAPNCTKTQSRLSFWKNGDKAWNFKTDKVTGDITLTAEWVSDPTVTHSVATFHSNGGTFADGSTGNKGQKFINGGLIVDPSCKKTNYNLDGWYKNAEFTSESKWNFGSDTITADIDLYAKWVEAPVVVKHTVTFDPNGGKFGDETTAPKTQEIVDGEKLISPSVSKTDSQGQTYSFEGWLKPDGINFWNFATDTVTSDLTLTAKWSTEPVTQYCIITFNAGDHGYFGTAATKTKQAVIKNGELLSSIVSPTVTPNDGYAFSKWLINGSPVTSETTITSDTTITASCIAQATDVTITFSVNKAQGESLSGASFVNVPKGTPWSEISGSINDPTKENCSFHGWYHSSGTAVVDADEFNNSETLVPNFEQDPASTVSIHFNLLSGQSMTSGSETLTIDLGDSTTTTWSQIPKPTIVDNSGKIFTGWYYDEEFTDPISDNETIYAGNEYEIYAKFIEEVSYPTITFSVESSKFGETVTWIGNTTIRGETNSLTWGNLDKPYAFYQASGSWSTGFTTDYYTDHWYYKDADGNDITLRDNSSINKDTTVYPYFTLKPVLNLSYFGKKTPTSTPEYLTAELKGEPTETWGSLAKPIALPDNITYIGYFTGWQGTDKSGTTKELAPYDVISSIDQTQDIIPLFTTDANPVVFTTAGIVNDGSETPITVTYSSNTENVEVGVKNQTSDVSFNTITTPSADHMTVGTTSYTFKNWQLSYDNTNWETVTTDTVIDAGETTIYVRPVMEADVIIEYDAGDYGSLEDPDQSKYSTNSSTEFKKMFKPQLTVDTGYVFQYWATKNGDTYTKVEPTQKFSESTKLYAVYTTTDTSSTVEFRLLPDDEPQEGVTKEFPATLSGSKTTVIHQPGSGLTFGEITKGYATKKLHTFQYWAKMTMTGDYEEVKDSDVLPEGNEHLIVYAIFNKDDSFRKLSVVESPTEYEITSSESCQYYQSGDSFYASNFAVSVMSKNVGEEFSHWQYKDGDNWVDLDEGHEINDNMQLKPIFNKGVYKQVELSNEGNTSVSFPNYGTSGTLVIPYNDTLWKYLYDSTKVEWKISATWDTKNQFIGWQIKNSDGSYTDIDAEHDVNVLGKITIVPKFRGESEFKEGNLPYFFDDTKGKWASIVSSTETSSCLTVKYAGDETTTTIDKETFNYEISFGKNMTSIPDYFLYGCINWNNGSDGETLKPLAIPSYIQSIGKYVFAGCTSFDQTINFGSYVHEYEQFYIGESFMAQCYSFNSEVHMEDRYWVYIGNGFMYDCKSWTGLLKLPIWLYEDGTGCDYSFATSDPYCPLAITGFHLPSAGTRTRMSYSDFKDAFPITTSAPYRKHGVI